MSSKKKFSYKKDFRKNRIQTFKWIFRLREDMKTPLKNHHNRA
jgi:hypothetical protein